MSEAVVAAITSIAALGASVLGFVASTYVQDRARMQRENTLAAALLSEVERIHSRLPKVEPTKQYDPMALSTLERLHAWVEPTVVELAGIDRRLYLLLVDLGPTIAKRSEFLEQYQQGIMSIYYTDAAIASHKGTIETSADESQIKWARDNLGHKTSELAELETRAADAGRLVKLAAAAVEQLLSEIEWRLAKIVARPIPRFPFPRFGRSSRASLEPIEQFNDGRYRLRR